jgi:hypothetical protein
LVKRYDISTTQTKVGSQRRAFCIALPLNDYPQNPSSCAGWIYDKIKSAAITVAPSRNILDQFLRQFASKCKSSYHFSYHAMTAYDRNRNKSSINVT